MNRPAKRLGELLVDAGYVSQAQLQEALQRQGAFGGRLIRILAGAGIVAEDGVARFLATHLRLPLADFSAVDAAAVRMIPLEMAQRFSVFPMAIRKDGSVQFLSVAMADPTNVDAVDAITFKTGRRVLPVVATESAVEAAIRAHYQNEQLRAQAPAPMQFAGHEVELEAGPALRTVEEPSLPTQRPSATSSWADEIPVVEGVLSPPSKPPFAGVGGTASIAALPPTAATEIMDLTELERTATPLAAPAPPTADGDAELEFGAIQAPFSTFTALPPLPPLPAAPRPPPAAPPTQARPTAILGSNPVLPRGTAIMGSNAMSDDVAPTPSNVRSTGSPAAPAAPEKTSMANPNDALAATTNCPKCGTERVSGSKFCVNCGTSFTGAVRAKGDAPAPVQAPSALATVIPIKQGEPLDVNVLEGLRPAGNTIQPRPRTASAANVDEPTMLGGKDSNVGIGVTQLVPSVVTTASHPDDPDLLGGGKGAPPSPVVPMHMHRVTEAMAKVDDVGNLTGPAAPRTGGFQKAAAPVSSAAPATLVIQSPVGSGAPGTLVITSPVAAAALDGAPLHMPQAAGVSIVRDAFSLDQLEGLGKTSTGAVIKMTSPSALVDDDSALQNGPAFRLHLGVTHLAPFLGDAALVDEPAVLGGGKADHSPILRAVYHRRYGDFAAVDDVKTLNPSGKVSLARDWADAAERPIPRKDDRANVPVPKSREIFVALDTTPPPPPPEPVVEYKPQDTGVPAAAAAVPTPAAGSPAPPWAQFKPPEAAGTANAAANGGAPAKKPGLATMIMNLDDVEKKELSERLRQKAAEESGKGKK